MSTPNETSAPRHHWTCWKVGREDYLCPICGEVRTSGACNRCGLIKGQCSTACEIGGRK